MHELVILALGLALTMAEVQPDVGGMRDQFERPAEVRSFRSPSGQFILEIRALDRWSTPKAEAEMFEVGKEGQRKSAWKRPLAHRYGVRTALVNDRGRTVLLDEWFRSVGPLAIVLLGENGQVLRQHSFSEIAKISLVEANFVVNTARLGAWMSAEPSLAADGRTALLHAAGIALKLNVENGELTRVGADTSSDKR